MKNIGRIIIFSEGTLVKNCRYQSTSSATVPTYALTCPGQGLVRAGLLKPYMKYEKHFKSLLEEINETLNEKFTEKLTDETIPIEFYHKTSNSQPAILLVSCLINEVMKKEFGFNLVEKSDYMLGHSLGEFTALTLSGAFKLSDAVFIVRRRGILMEDATRDGNYGMVSVLFKAEQFDQVVKFFSNEKKCYLANINSLQQVVLSGDLAELEKVVVELKEHLASKKLKAVRLPVQIPFHSSILKTIEPELRSIINNKKSNKSDLIKPVISNLTGMPTISQTEALDNFISATGNPVQWVEATKYLENKINRFINLGPGEVLSGLNKKTVKLNNLSLDSIEQMESFTPYF